MTTWRQAGGLFPFHHRCACPCLSGPPACWFGLRPRPRTPGNRRWRLVPKVSKIQHGPLDTVGSRLGTRPLFENVRPEANRSYTAFRIGPTFVKTRYPRKPTKAPSGIQNGCGSKLRHMLLTKRQNDSLCPSSSQNRLYHSSQNRLYHLDRAACFSTLRANFSWAPLCAGAPFGSAPLGPRSVLPVPTRATSHCDSLQLFSVEPGRGEVMDPRIANVAPMSIIFHPAQSDICRCGEVGNIQPEGHVFQRRSLHFVEGARIPEAKRVVHHVLWGCPGMDADESALVQAC